MIQRVRVALAVGGNLGDRIGVLARAVAALTEEFLSDAVASSFYETPPWGIREQPDFLNLVVVGDSEWKPPAILNFVKALERDLGRVPGLRNGPRLVDIDIIAYGEQVWNSPEVTVPHPRMHEREFVLVPMCEVWPQWRHPLLGRTAEQLLRELRGHQPAKARLVAPPPLSTV